MGVLIAMGILWLLQARQPGGDLPRSAPLPSQLRVLLLLQATIMLLVGASAVLILVSSFL